MLEVSLVDVKEDLQRFQLDWDRLHDTLFVACGFLYSKKSLHRLLIIDYVYLLSITNNFVSLLMNSQDHCIALDSPMWLKLFATNITFPQEVFHLGNEGLIMFHRPKKPCKRQVATQELLRRLPHFPAKDLLTASGADGEKGILIHPAMRRCWYGNSL